MDGYALEAKPQIPMAESRKKEKGNKSGTHETH
jgi:hypothetical protein